MRWASGKQLKHYLENKRSQTFLEVLARSAGIPADLLLIIKTTAPRYPHTPPLSPTRHTLTSTADFLLKATI